MKGDTTSPARLAILELDKKFPNTSSRGLARLIMREMPGAFTTCDSAYRTIRKMRNGDAANQALPKSMSGTPYKGGDAFSELPEGDASVIGKPWEPVQIQGPLTALVMSDIHIPYHRKEPLLIAVNKGKECNVDTVILNGDIADCHCISQFVKDPRARKFKHEVEMVTDFLEMLREKFKNARIIWKLGNHEERYQTYMRVKCPEILDLDSFSFESVYDTRRIGVKVVDEKRPIQIGKLSLAHGHEYRFAISNPVNPARGLFLKARDYALCGHFHQPSFHTAGTIRQSNIAAWSTGCLCELHPAYMPMNEWSWGFAIVEVERDGTFQVKNRTIKGGKIY